MPYVIPHDKKSRDVLPEDMATVTKDGEEMLLLCGQKHGYHKAARAIAHSQINNTDPLRFFVTNDGTFVINPVVTRHSSTKYLRQEGCMSYPLFQENHVERWLKMEVEYLSIEADGEDKLKMVGPIKRQLKGLDAQIWQHELDHFEAQYVWPYIYREGQPPEDGVYYKEGWAMPVMRVALTEEEVAELSKKANIGEPAPEITEEAKVSDNN